MKQISMVKTVLKLALVSVVGLLVACSSSSDSTPPPPPPADASISGIITAAPVSGASVSVVGVDGKVVAGPVTTDAAGKYSLTIPGGSLAQDLIVKSTGGAFLDEATGDLPGTVGDGEMFAYMAANSISNGSSVSVTPGSTIVAHLVMNHGKFLTVAQSDFFNGFGYIPDMSVTPVNATVAAVDASDASKLAGLSAAAFSQLAKDMGLSQDDQFRMFVALAQDLSDSKPDGLMAGAAIDIVSTDSMIGTIPLPTDILKRSANAMIDFQKSAYNQMNLTSTYRIEYLSAMAMAGKSTFTFKITNSGTSNVETALVPKVMPMMHMAADHKHSTPLTDVVNNGDGTYTVTIYYLMPSIMNGLSTGYWDLGVTVDNETVHFNPNVMMSMGDTFKVTLKGVEDTITNMDGLTVSRNYPIFKDSLMANMGGTTYDFSVFVAAQETMMSFPAVFGGSLLSGNTLDATVEISDDDGATYKQAVDGGNGIWSVSGLSLTDGVEDQIRIRLTINDTVVDEMKTTNGLIREVDVNDYQTFTVTPGGM